MEWGAINGQATGTSGAARCPVVFEWSFLVTSSGAAESWRVGGRAFAIGAMVTRLDTGLRPGGAEGCALRTSFLVGAVS